MKIAFINTNLITCGGIITNFEYAKRLNALGIETVLMAKEGNKSLEDCYGIYHQPIDLRSWTDEDVIIANRWEQCDELEQYKGRKIQFVQGNDLAGDIGDDFKERCRNARNNPNWELIGVSDYCLEGWGRGTVIPNGVGEQFKPSTYRPEIYDILVEGNDEPNKQIPQAMEIAKGFSDNIIWVGREADARYQTAFKTYTQKEMPRAYQDSKILIKMSKSEGFSLPVLEAMACGCLVATIQMGGNDFCTWGYNCIYPAEIGEYLKDDYKREQVIRAGLETAKQYSWNNSINLLLKYLNG